MKWYSSIKIQFIICFTLFISVSVGISAIMGGRKVSQATMETYAQTGSFIAEQAASVIDGDKFEALARSLDKDDPFYEETRLRLFDIKEFSLCEYLFTMSPAVGNTARYIIDGSVDPSDTEHFSKLGDEEDISEDATYQNAFIFKETQVSDLEHMDDWGWLVTIYAPIFNSAGRMVGVVGCDFDGTFLHSTISSEKFEQLIIAVISVAVGFLLLLFFLQKIFVPIGKINGIVKEISMGEGDLTKRINSAKDDELGNLAAYFNITLDKIKNMIVAIKNETFSSFEAGNNLATTMHDTADAVLKITDTIQSVKQKASSQASSVAETSAAMQLVTLNIDQLTRNVEDQTESVDRSSTAIEQMLANVQSVTNTLVHNEKNVHELIEVSDVGRSSLQKVSQDIQEIAKESEGLLQINTVMENIASQTNLLSMNAAIEAAHAGESGKGFAVVAGEIRKLAVSSAEQSKTISEVLKRIKTAIDKITVSTNTVLEKFQAIEDRVHTVSQQETNIRSAMEEQGKGSQQILEAVAMMNELTQKVKRGAKEMSASSRDVIEESKNLEKVTIEITNGMNEMADGAQQINAAVSRVNEISGTNKDCISALSAEVSRFKVE